MIYYLAPIAFLIGLALVFGSLKRMRRRALFATFRRYNEQKDLGVVLDWIRARDTRARLLDVIEYLIGIEKEDLAAEVLDAYGPDRLENRHARIFACKIYKHVGRGKEALRLSEALIRENPNDDSILDLYIDMRLSFGETEKAREALTARMQRKTEGTSFTRHYARLLAIDGRTDEAVELLTKVVNQDYARYKNTVAPLHRRLIYEQYVESKTLLDEISGEKTDE